MGKSGRSMQTGRRHRHQQPTTKAQRKRMWLTLPHRTDSLVSGANRGEISSVDIRNTRQNQGADGRDR